ncbi:MAG: hypothetical protein MH252_09570 [Thermosynechococcaceae cyanobacterium MS004]|nr:hypothetical protein [Thermosynechococcaceae cyanobacterium MS004]
MTNLVISELNEQKMYCISGENIIGGYGYTAGAVANQFGVAVSAGSGSTASLSFSGFDALGRAFSLSFAF